MDYPDWMVLAKVSRLMRCWVLVLVVWCNVSQAQTAKTKVSRVILSSPGTSPLIGPVFIYEPPHSVDFSNSSGAVVECSAHGQPQPKVEWIHAETLSAATNITSLLTVLPNSTLIFPPFDADHYHSSIHSAVYQCRASNLLGTIISRPVHVRAVVLQNYDAQVYDEYVIRGNTAVLKCQIPTFIADYVKVISWVRNSVVSIEPNLRTDSKFIVLPSGELYILNVSSLDSTHTFQCQTEHILTKEKRLSATTGRLVVTDTNGSVPPRITDTKATVHVHENEVAAITCAAQGHPVPQYRWLLKREGNVINVTGSEYRQLGAILIIDNARRSHVGTYVCVAYNSMGREVTETTLIVTAPLSVHIEPAQQVLDQGRSATFSCVTSGYPILSIVWRKDGRLLPHGNPKDVLKILNVTKESAGMYQCFVTNSQESVQSTAELRLGDAAPEVIYGFGSDIVNPNTGASLKCILTGIPVPEVRWTINDFKLSSSNRIRIDQVNDGKGNVISHVNISRLMVEDGGTYACVGRNVAGTVTHEAELLVHGNPYIHAMPKIISVAGEDLKIKCPVSGYPIDVIMWEKDGARLPLNHRQKVSQNGTLYVKNMQRMPDAGKYTCIAKNKRGQVARKDVEVAVQVPPKIIPFSFQEDQTYEGVRASLFCSLSQGDLPLTIDWLKDNRRIHPTSEISTHTIDKFASSLIIQKLLESHSGNYTCSATNAAATITHTAELIVKVPPRWKVEPEDTEVLLGDPVKIDCQTDGYPPPTISWFKSIDVTSGDFTELMNTTQTVVTASGSLQVTSTAESDEGFYMCKATNTVGSGLSKVVFLNIKVPALFELKLRNTTIRVGDNAELICEARGDNPIQVTWSINKDTKGIAFNQRYSVQDFSSDSGMTSVLTISSVERSDSRVFDCLAQNPYGQDEMTIMLSVKDLPETPFDVKIFKGSSRFIQLTWHRPYDGNIPLLGYVVQYTLKSDWKSDIINKTVGNDETKTTLTGLLPSTKYFIRVLAQNELGLSKPSPMVFAVTEEEAPSGSPRDVKVEAMNSQTLRITWKSPDKGLWNGAIRGYHVGSKLHEFSEPYIFATLSETDDDQLIMRLDKLKKFSKYSIVVQAFNDKGVGPLSDEVVAITSEDVPSSSPSNIKCSAVSSQSLHINWDAMSAYEVNGQLQGYKILYRPVKEWYGPYGGYETKITTALKTMLHGLEKYTNYSIHVLAFTHVGDGSKSEAIYCATMEDVPGPPAEIKALTASLDAIMVSWREPMLKNGAITKYTVYIRSSDSSREETSKVNVPANVYHYEAKSLGRNRNYEFWVTASTSIGEGQSTKVAKQKTQGPLIPARIASSSKRFLIPWNESVRLPCIHVGMPLPTVKWLFEGEPLHLSNRISLQRDGSISLKEIDSSSNGNYTCIVQNSVDLDNITHVVAVEVPPEPPSLSVISTTENSVVVGWTISNAGISKMEQSSFVLNYRPEYGQWIEAMLEPDARSFTLHGLTCGTKYQLYITAINKIGKGAPSEIITAKTKGEVPQTPMKNKVISVNTTFIVLHLEMWSDGGCPISYFVVEYRHKDSSEWILVSNNVKPDNSRFVVTDLRPEESYSLRITAHNSAGSNSAHYVIETYKDVGEHDVLTRTESTLLVEENTFWFYDLSIILPVISSLFLMITVISVLCICFVKKSPTASVLEKVTPKYYSADPKKAEIAQKTFYCGEMQKIENGNLRDPRKTSTDMHDKNILGTFHVLKSAADYHPVTGREFTSKSATELDYESEYPVSANLYCENNRDTVQSCSRYSIPVNERKGPDLVMEHDDGEHEEESSSSDEYSSHLHHRLKHFNKKHKGVHRNSHDLSNYHAAFGKNKPQNVVETTFTFPRSKQTTAVYLDKDSKLYTDKKFRNIYEEQMEPITLVKLY